MQSVHRSLVAATLAVLAGASVAGSVYTSSGSFLSHVAPGSYTETFTGLADPAGPGGLNFSGGGFSYTATAPLGLYVSAGFLGTNQIDSALTLMFTSGNVTALGANFFATNIADEFQSVALTLTLSDGTVESFTPSTLSDSYRGFTSNVAFSSLVISGPGPSLYAGLDNLTVGAAIPVPEPTSLALLGVGLMAFRFVRRRAA